MSPVLVSIGKKTASPNGIVTSLALVHSAPSYASTRVSEETTDSVQISTDHSLRKEQNNVNTLVQENVSSIYNASTTSNFIMNTTTIKSLVTTNPNIQGRVVTTSYASTSSSSDSSLSAGAIVGIIFAIIFVLCCCGCCGAGAKSGHWETREVFVTH
ncbi:unnamed protein product [Rotaria magnacalcarata]|uniref:Uncharacterized protein n=1 Tax=Rotaria magnacalcarata TaxID=392030 RepID=A0A816VCX9_9BILA|nr:unnamed protein product [Rotaria magnacalcarata]CAF2234604.1 unnamed protein product [Rotaria magnacalcarata]CAF4073748.1 unnamed protein product [Rotaria magnacalcarata]